MVRTLVDWMSVKAAEGSDTFVGDPDAYGVIGVYGGHFLGQALAAGLATVDEPKLAHSLHGYFLKPGDPDAPIHYQVVRLREGRGSDVRAITASQHGQPVFQMSASFKLAEAGDEHQPEMPGVEHPDVLRGREHAMPFSPPPTKENRTEMILASEHFMQPEFVPGREAALRMWIRSPADRPLTDRESQLVLAYLSDGTLMFNSVIPHGLPFQSHRLTSIDHAAWFHRVCNVTDWMLFDQHSSAAADGRGMNHGSLYDRDGRLVMTLAQESMLRRIPRSD